MSKKLLKNSYIILAIGLLVFELFHISKGRWSGDFWEHSAVVNELSKNLLYPKNPILNSNIPHAFFSPYAIIVSLFSKITSLNSIQSLAFFSVINLLLFLSVFLKFCEALFKKNTNLLATISLIFILFFWGFNPYKWSGFYHIYGLHHILAYPSTFAFILSLLALTILLNNLHQISYLKGASILFINTFVLITHPTTALFLFATIFSIYVTTSKHNEWQKIKIVSVLIIPSVFLASFWPYFNFLSLFSGVGSNFHSDSLVLYSEVFTKYWPIAIIIISFSNIRNHVIVRFLIFTSILLLLVYSIGYLFKIYGVSRVIANSMMLTQILLAYILFDDLKNNLKNRPIFIGSLFLLSLIINFYPLKKAANIFYNSDNSYYEQFHFLREFVNPYDVILSDSKSNWIIPSFNGKVIASNHPLYWVDDLAERRLAVEAFFKNSTNIADKRLILNIYNPDYILIDHSKNKLNDNYMNWMEQVGESVYQKETIQLFKVVR